MSKTIELTDEQYAAIEEAARCRRRTARALIYEWVAALRDGGGVHGVYETDDWFRHLGATEEEIAEAKRIAAERTEALRAEP